ncbi:MmyB family transcriptional regulator [Streptomyces sp. NPDC005134]|uniref:MmyB family transcriptional regulator n=1 Tax=unclassified Streptomyces TaxID=2593676 RepID=UPI0033A9C45A
MTERAINPLTTALGWGQDVVASNLLGNAMFAPLCDCEQPDLARFTFLDSRARDFYADWPLACSLSAACCDSKLAAPPRTAT